MIIWLTGRIAAGKWVVEEFLKEKWFEYLTLSLVVRDEAAKLGIEVTRKNLQDLWNQVRLKDGPWAWAKKLVEKIQPGKNYVIAWIRHPWEVYEFRKLHEFYLISVDSNQDLRFQRLLKRAKDSDPTTWEWFLEIDNRDFWESDNLWQQVGKCMDLADFSVDNNWTLEEFNQTIEKIYDDICERVS